jgi:hypothetical protein
MTTLIILALVAVVIWQDRQHRALKREVNARLKTALDNQPFELD